MKPPFHVLKSKTYSEKRNNLRLVLWLSRMLLLEGDTDVKKKTPIHPIFIQRFIVVT